MSSQIKPNHIETPGDVASTRMRSSSRLGLLLAASMAGLSMAFLQRAGPALKPVSGVRRLGALHMSTTDDSKVGGLVGGVAWTRYLQCREQWLGRPAPLLIID